jgi:membrane fusion protein, multidrug efflux system
VKELLAAIGIALAAALPLAAAELVVEPIAVTETKALFGRVESRFVVPARGRIGGTLTTLDVTEGSSVEAGAVIARIIDTKLESQVAAAEARIAAAQSQLQNAETELARNAVLLERGATTLQRVDQVRTTVDVARNAVIEAEAARQVVVQQMAEGDVVAPTAGRILTVPVRLGEVMMPGEPVAMIAGGGVYLRLAIPERHAAGLAVGATVAVEGGEGRIEKVYPLIENGRVTADVAVEGLSDIFIGQRVLVQVPVAEREVLAIPPEAIETRSGLDFVRIRAGEAAREVTVVPGGVVETPDGPMREVLTGLRPGDTVILP